MNRAITGIFVAAMMTALPAGASMVITPTFDGSINSDSNAAAIKGAINQAIGIYDSLFANNINVSIYFQEFTANSGLGESDVGSVYIPSYKTYYDNLVTTNANPTAINTLTLGGGNGDTNGGVDPVIGAGQIAVKSADARAVGISGDSALCHVTAGDTSPATNVPNHCSGAGAVIVDGIITLNTNITSPPNTPSGNYSLLAVAEHEIDEVLGLGSFLPNTVSGSAVLAPSFVAPEDLWRYNATGSARVYNVNCASPGTAYFSITGNSVNQQFNNACNGDDFGDWAGGGGAQIQDAVGTTGVNIGLGNNEIAALSAIGYQFTGPEPGTIVLLLSALGAIVLLRRRQMAARR